MEEPKIYRKIVINFMIAFVILVLSFFVLPKLIGFFAPFVIGWIIAMIANPLVKFMEKRIKIVRKHSSAIIIVVVLVAIIVILYFAVSVLVRESLNMVSDLPNLYENIENQLQIVAIKMERFYIVMPEGVKDFSDNFTKSLGEYFGNFLNNMHTPTISDAGTFVKNVADILFTSIITILSAYFFIAERDNIVKGMKKIMPKSVQKQYSVVIDNFARAFGGYFKAQFKIMFIITIIIFIGLEIFKINYSFLFALVIAFIDLLPIFGTGIVLGPWAFVDMVTGNYVRAIGLVVIYLICQVVKQVLQPKMVGDSIGLSPLATLTFMFIGYRFRGVFGMILGIPIGMVMVNFYRSGVFDSLLKGAKIIIRNINEYRKY
jgi:sporulation integral membrane protein YtvI